MALPSFLVVGAIKSGTTSLYQYLIQHPEIFLSPNVKESRFLAGVSARNNPDIVELVPAITEFADYRQLFENATDRQTVGEVDPWCLYLYEQAIPRIKTYLDSSVRIIMCLRNPVERSYSHYYQVVKQGWEIGSFEQTFEDVLAGNSDCWYERASFEAGLYHDQVSAYLDTFEPEQILVFLFDDLRADVADVFGQICRFIDVDHNFMPNTSKKMNVGGVPKSRTLHNLLTRSYTATSVLKPFLPAYVRRRIRYTLISHNLRSYPAMTDSIRERLVDYYRQDILKLQDLLEKDLSSWLVYKEPRQSVV